MPSPLHETLLLLFRNRPELAPELLREALGVELPAYTEARIDSADVTQVQPTQYLADLVVLLLHGAPVLGIVVEVQLTPDPRKVYSWPVYVAALRARLECPVCLLVVTVDEATARWAGRVLDLGGGNRFAPLVLGPSGVPIVTDVAHARIDPELAVFSAMAHGRDADIERAVRIALAAQTASETLDAERSGLYFDLVLEALSEGARKALQAMDPAKYEYQSDFAKRYFALGKNDARSGGRVELLARQLTLRFGSLPEDAIWRLATASIEELNAIGERLLTASTLQVALNASE